MEAKKKYLIGDVAKIAGITRDSLRFYEKKGIIQAEKSENGYRYYSEDDIYSLVHILYHRKMNFGLKEIEKIKGMDKDGTINFMREYLDTSIKREEELVRSHKRAIARMKLTKRDIQNMEKHTGKYSLKRFPSTYIIGEYRDFQEGLENWFQISALAEGLDMTYFYTELSLGEKEISVKNTRLLFYKEMEQALGDEVNLRGFQKMDRGKCIYTAAATKEMLPEKRVLEEMAAWGRKKGLAPEPRVYVNLMTSFSWKSAPSYGLELYMPVKEPEVR